MQSDPNTWGGGVDFHRAGGGGGGGGGRGGGVGGGVGSTGQSFIWGGSARKSNDLTFRRPSTDKW